MSARGAGVLVPVASLPGPGGVGDLGPASRRWVDALAAARHGLWSMLPLGVADPAYGDSPYCTLSAFALDPLLLAPEDLVAEGLLDRTELDGVAGPSARIDPARARARKEGLVRPDAFARRAPRALRQDLAGLRAQSPWLEDFALFRAVRRAAHGAPWTSWSEDLRDRSPRTLARTRRRLRAKIEQEILVQLLLARQQRRLRAHAASRGVLLLGDVPLYVAHDSADVWVNRALFALDPEGRPREVAGVPPDAFSPTGQRWGMPVYRWAAHREEGFAWWTARIAAHRACFDLVRIDHFRGLAAYWSVPAGAATAASGRWVRAPGAHLLRVLRERLPGLELVAEDLGVIDEEVRGLRDRFGLAGMRVLQFAFGDDFPASEHLPWNLPCACVAYTGTHDNDTTRGWFEHQATPAVRRRVACVVGHAVTPSGAPEALMRLAYASHADRVVVPLQDVLGLGTSARLNRPGTPWGNWRWRAPRRALAAAVAERLRRLAETFGRAASAPSRPPGGAQPAEDPG